MAKYGTLNPRMQVQFLLGAPLIEREMEMS